VPRSWSKPRVQVSEPDSSARLMEQRNAGSAAACFVDLDALKFWDAIAGLIAILGAVIAFMTWMWLSSIVILVGAELNAVMEHHTACDSTRSPVHPKGREERRWRTQLEEKAFAGWERRMSREDGLEPP
jgi:hypothetical protein